MSMVVKNNIPAVYGLGTLNRNSTALSKSLEKVSTGMKINSAADDNSAWSISERMRVRIRGLDQADQNTQNGRSLLKVAEGAVQSTVDILKTLKEKAINAANDTNTDADRQTIQKELNQSIDQIDDNANVTYNGKILMDGSKNTIGSATYTALTNSSLSTDTQAGTLLTNLKDRSGAGLNILSTDKVTVSYVQGGKTYATTYTVGNSSLQNIFVQAEAIDGSTQAFGSNGNLSVAAAKGITDAESIRQREQQLREAVENTYNAYQSALSTQSQKASAVTTAQGEVTAAQNAIVNAKNNVHNQYVAIGTAINNVTPFSYTIGATPYTYSSADIAAMKASYNDWGNSGTAATNNDPAPSDVSSYGVFNEFLETPKLRNGSTATQAVGSAYDTYTSSFNTLYNSTGDGSLTALNQTLSEKNTALSTALGEKATADAAVVTTKAAYDQAVANQAAEAGPQVLYEDKIGLTRSGEMLKTVDGKNALTITAQNSGIGGQISGLSIRITDSEGNVKTAANAALDAFSETIRAENASEDNALTLHVGADPGVAINLGMTDMRSEALGLKGSDGTKLDISTQERANAAISVLDNAIQKALNQQTDIGNIASRLEYTSANLRVASDNVQASESTIRDADMAKEMTAYTKNNVLLSASQSMLSQANQNSMNVMTLLQ